MKLTEWANGLGWNMELDPDEARLLVGSLNTALEVGRGNVVFDYSELDIKVDIGVKAKRKLKLPVGADAPDRICRATGLIYVGLQDMPGGRPSKMFFTDPVTRSTLLASTLSEAKDRLTTMRARFGQPPPVFPISKEGVKP